MFTYAFLHCSIDWRVLQKIQEERRKTLIIILLWATQIWVTRIMELAFSLPIMISNQYTKLPETSKRHPTHAKLWMMALLITNRYHLQNQFRKMHKQIYQQCGETLQNRNTTIDSKDGPIFVVKEVSIYCTHQQKTWPISWKKNSKGVCHNSLNAIRSALRHCLPYDLVNQNTLSILLRN